MKSFRKVYGRLIIIFLLSFSAYACSSAGTGSKSSYPEPRSLKLAPLNRQEFVSTFLQGKWCESTNLFDDSIENYLRSDDFCEVYNNYILAWKLKRYAGVEDPQLLDKAKYYHDLGFGCPDNKPFPSASGNAEIDHSKRDRLYQKLLSEENFEPLKNRLVQEEDQLYASVYGRKAAKAAMAADNMKTAEHFLQITRNIDGKLGWIVFLLEDWRLSLQIVSEPEQKIILERIHVLKALIQPCSPK